MDELIYRQAVIEALCSRCAIDKPETCSTIQKGDGWCDDVYTILNLPSAQQEQRWIPCSEEPDTDRNVFIARGRPDFMTVCIGYYDHGYKQWYENRNWFAKCLYDGLYWCEVPSLPEPYREEGV